MSDNRKIWRRQRCPECGPLDVIKRECEPGFRVSSAESQVFPSWQTYNLLAITRNAEGCPGGFACRAD